MNDRQTKGGGHGFVAIWMKKEGGIKCQNPEA